MVVTIAVVLWWAVVFISTLLSQIWSSSERQTLYLHSTKPRRAHSHEMGNVFCKRPICMRFLKLFPNTTSHLGGNTTWSHSTVISSPSLRWLLAFDFSPAIIKSDRKGNCHHHWPRTHSWWSVHTPTPGQVLNVFLLVDSNHFVLISSVLFLQLVGSS